MRKEGVLKIYIQDLKELKKIANNKQKLAIDMGILALKKSAKNLKQRESN